MSNITGVVRNISTSNPSVGTTGSTVPASTNQVGGADPSGNLAAVNIDANGKLLVNASGFSVQNLNVLFNEVDGIAVGIETTIGTYTPPVGKTAYLLTITGSGENRATFNIYNNGTLFDRQYTNVTQLNAPFDYKTGASSVPGMVIAAGHTVTVTTINAGTSSANYTSRIMVLEVS